MPPIQITDPVKDVAKINSAFQQLDALYTRLAAAEKQINFVQQTSTQHQQLAEITGVNNITFNWTGATGTISWNAGSVLNRQGNHVPIPAGSIKGLSASTTYWLAWNPIHQVMASGTSLASVQPNKNNLVICNVTTLGAGSNGAIGGGGTDPGGTGFNRSIYAKTGGGSGTVTSVGLSMPPEFSVSGSPVTASGTLAVSKVNESANQVYAGPSSGAAAAPGFRSLVPADYPVFLPSGASHAVGAVPDPGSVAGTTRFLREDATWVSPGSSSGGLVLLEQHTAVSGDASINFTTSISSTYDEYLVEALHLTPLTNGDSLYLRVSTNGGTTWDSTAGHYNYEIWVYQTGFNTITGSASASQIQVVSGGSSTLSNGGAFFSLKLYDPLDATRFKAMLLLQSYRPLSSDGNPYAAQGGGSYLQTAAYNAFQLLFSTGNIAAGTVRCYGIAK